MKFTRFFTDEKSNAYNNLKFKTTSSEIKNPDGTIVFNAPKIEVPDNYSQVAADVIAQAFCRHLAKQKYSQDKLGLGRDPVESVLSLYDRMVRNYAKKIHAVYNP